MDSSRQNRLWVLCLWLGALMFTSSGLVMATKSPSTHYQLSATSPVYHGSCISPLERFLDDGTRLTASRVTDDRHAGAFSAACASTIDNRERFALLWFGIALASIAATILTLALARRARSGITGTALPKRA